MGNFTAITIVHSIIVHKMAKKYAKKVMYMCKAVGH